MSEDKSREFRLITGAPDNVVAAQQWCEAHPGTEIRFADGWYRAVRGTDELAVSITLRSLLDKLACLPGEGGEPQ